MNEIIRQYHRHFIRERKHANALWRGYRVIKPPGDLWNVQMILHECHPDLIIETGTLHGGSAYYYSDLLKMMGIENGEVVTIDKRGDIGPRTDNITYLKGGSTTEYIIHHLQPYIDRHHQIMVILDSDHSEAHVLKELELYSPFVTPGQFLIVEDTHIGHPVYMHMHQKQSGPMEAVQKWLQTEQGKRFTVTNIDQHFLMSFHYDGYLKRIG